VLYAPGYKFASALKNADSIILTEDLSREHEIFNCREVSQKVSESMDRSLSVFQQMMIRFHIQWCKYCARFSGQLLLIGRAIRSQENPDEGLETSDHAFSKSGKRIKQTLKD